MNKNFQLWFVALPIIAVAASLQLVYDFGERGNLHSEFLRETIYPFTRSVNGSITNLKFRMRGPKPAKNKVIVVEADEQSIEVLGRWPWHREIYAQLIHLIFKNGAKQVGLDVAYSESEERIPPELYQIIGPENQKVIDQIHGLEGDPILAQVFNAYQKKVSLGFSPIATCQPGYVDFTKPHPDCPIEDPDVNKGVADQLDRFALAEPYPFPTSVLWKTHSLTS